ncbi:MAG: hypothetical protein AAFO63_07660, partial [Pseudomonadota bacterium]
MPDTDAGPASTPHTSLPLSLSCRSRTERGGGRRRFGLAVSLLLGVLVVSFPSVAASAFASFLIAFFAAVLVFRMLAVLLGWGAAISRWRRREGQKTL